MTTTKIIKYIAWILALVLYAPIFKKLYDPLIKGFTRPDLTFFSALSEPWGGLADFTHAYFILPIFLWLIWRKRTPIKEIAQTQQGQSNRNFLSFFILLFGILIFIFGARQNYLFVTTFSLIPFLYGLTGYLHGIAIANKLSFPFIYLLFIVPPPVAVIDSITLPMRHWVSVMAELILNVLNYPISRDGLLLTIGYNDIFMGAPCSGLRSLITMFALLLIYVYVSKSSFPKKLILLSFVIPFAILGNVIRVIVLCLITFYFGEEAGQGFLHNFSGLIIFVITILGIIVIELLLEKINVKTTC